MKVFEYEGDLDLSFIDKHTWYRQGTDAALFFITSPMHGAFMLFGGRNAVCIHKGIHHKGFWAIDQFGPIVKDIFSKQKKDRDFIERYIRKWGNFRDKLNNIMKEDMSNLSKFIEKLSLARDKMWINGFYPELFDGTDEKYLKQEIPEMDEEDLKKLMRPTDISINSRIKLEKARDLSPKELHEKYKHVRNTWYHLEELDENYFENLKIDEEDIEKISSYKERVKKENEVIIKKYDLSKDAQNLFYMFQRLADFREERKFQLQKVLAVLKEVLLKVEKRTKVSYEDLLFLTVDEVLNILADGKDYSDLIRERKRFSGLMLIDGKIHALSGELAESINERIEARFRSQFKAIEGSIGNKGKAKGKAKIVLGNMDFDKFEKGDILVAPMTRPEYMPLMKKASAIITDEGGITCHAAIVSRELGLPCIIGTQVSTDILKDNDMVEVDADKGLVRKI